MKITPLKVINDRPRQVESRGGEKECLRDSLPQLQRVAVMVKQGANVLKGWSWLFSALREGPQHIAIEKDKSCFMGACRCLSPWTSSC